MGNLARSTSRCTAPKRCDNSCRPASSRGYFLERWAASKSTFPEASAAISRMTPPSNRSRANWAISGDQSMEPSPGGSRQAVLQWHQRWGVGCQTPVENRDTVQPRRQSSRIPCRGRQGASRCPKATCRGRSAVPGSALMCVIALPLSGEDGGAKWLCNTRNVTSKRRYDLCG